MGLLDKVGGNSSNKPLIVSCRECTKRCEIPDEIELYLCPKCESPLAEYPNIMADGSLFSFNNGVNKWFGTAGPFAGIDSSMRSIAEKAAIGIITGRMKPTFTFHNNRKFVKGENTIARSGHMGGLRVLWWIISIIFIGLTFVAPYPFICCSVLSIALALESGTQKRMSDVVLIAASKHPHLLAEEGACYCYLEHEKLILAFVWKGHTIDINTAVQHRSDAYLEVNWTSNYYGGGDDGYSAPAIEAVLRYPGRRRKIVMLNHEYTKKESAEKELKSMVRTEPWYPIIGAQFQI